MRINSKKIITFEIDTHTSVWDLESFHFITDNIWVWFTLSRTQSYEWVISMNGFKIPFNLVKHSFFLNGISAR